MTLFPCHEEFKFSGPTANFEMGVMFLWGTQQKSGLLFGSPSKTTQTLGFQDNERSLAVEFDSSDSARPPGGGGRHHRGQQQRGAGRQELSAGGESDGGEAEDRDA